MNKLGFGFLFARKGSKGLARKNIRKLAGKPLIEWTLDYLCQADKIEKVCISTDDEIILKKYTDEYNSKIMIHKRPDELCGDNITTEEVLADACNAMKRFITDKHFGVYMQITEPFRPSNILELCVEKFETGNFDSVFAATEVHKNFWLGEQGELSRLSHQNEYNLPRQKKRPLIREDTGICLVSDMSLFMQGKRIGGKAGYVFYDHFGSLIDIHDGSDLKLAEMLVKLVESQ